MINNVVLMGRMTADPELRITESGKNVCRFSIAVERSYVKNGEERKTDFINIIAWNSTAKFVCDYFKKGSMIALQGCIQTRQYEDKSGNKRTAFEIIAREVSFCNNKNENAQKPTADNLPNEGYASASSGDFEEITDDEDLPF